jgi:hypothetical protein
MSQVKIYDFFGNLQFKIGIDFDFVDSEAFIIKEVIQDSKILDNLEAGFKYYSHKSRLYINVSESTNLDNVLILKEDFELGKTLRIQLKKKLPSHISQDEPVGDRLDANAMTIRGLIEKLYLFENVRSDLKNKNSVERNKMTKKLIGLSLNSIYYYKSMVRKAKQMGFDFEYNMDKYANLIRQFVSEQS